MAVDLRKLRKEAYRYKRLTFAQDAIDAANEIKKLRELLRRSLPFLMYSGQLERTVRAALELKD